MKKSNLSIIKKTMVTVLAVALSVTMVQPAIAAKKNSAIRINTCYLTQGENDQSTSNTDTALISSWTYMLENTLAFTYTFKADGTGTYTVEGETLKFTYETDGKNLTIHFEKDTNPAGMTVPYRIAGSSLIITDGTGSELEYKKS